jgi:integrating conjugative element membrane protein (TIGR03747 family)
MTPQRIKGVLWILLAFCLVSLLTLAVDWLYVYWPYPHGARGIAALQYNVRRESQLIERLADGRSQAVIQRVNDTLYKVLFGWTGLDEMMRRAANPAPLSPLNEIMRSFMTSVWGFLDTAVIGLQFYSQRLGVLILSLPLILITALAAGADGLMAWYLRRSAAERESGFIYHRGKRGVLFGLIVLWVVYLVPPVPIDPRWVIGPFLPAVGISVRITMTYFKKYL